MAPSKNATRRLRHRTLLRVALAVAVLAGTGAILSVPTATAADLVPTLTPAAVAVRALTSDAPEAAAVIPGDFRAVTGYSPVMVDGLPAAPHGSCSSPVTLPVEFEPACQAHDLGYDLLRYAEHRGGPLGPWARQALDRTLADRMRAVCAHRPDPLPRARCVAMAEVATVAVDLNSRRQGYGVPVVERFSPFETATTWLPRILVMFVPVLAALLLLRGTAGPRLSTRALAERRRSGAHPLTPHGGNSHV
ncbi:hypothetical protein [Nocardia brevicatena]|uniref:hypothetical protein n=1 Tax=Nocardia brevicatena TaxID=37327 RepID=UPI0012FB682B|nr:hypothetical protein [Nocardia brevicatena]